MSNPISDYLERRRLEKNHSVWKEVDAVYKDQTLGSEKTKFPGKTKFSEKKEETMPDTNIKLTWPSRETLATAAWILGSKQNIEQAKKVVRDSAGSTDQVKAAATSLSAWIDTLLPNPARDTALSEPVGSLLLAAMDQIEWEDIAIRLIDLYS